jgi:hypothetical protein
MIDDSPNRPATPTPGLVPSRIVGSRSTRKGNPTSGGRRSGGHSAYRQLVDGMDRLAFAIEALAGAVEASNPAQRFKLAREARDMLTAARADITRARNVAGKIERAVANG